MESSDVDWGNSEAEEAQPSKTTSFASHLTAVVRTALNVGSWSQVTSARTSPRTTSPSTSSSSSTPPRPRESGMEPQEVGMEPRETPYPVDVEALPGPQSIHQGTSDLEQVPGPQKSLTRVDEEPKVPKSKKRPQPAVQPFPERSVTEDQKAEASKAKGAVRSEEVVTVEAGGRQPATGAPEEHAAATKEHARALGGQEEEEIPHAGPEEVDSEATGISESGARGGARVDANPGQH
ncbi:unnamed protein product, partial [Symbiodinium sp. KB8]